jgi:hypothetical protein
MNLKVILMQMDGKHKDAMKIQPDPIFDHQRSCPLLQLPTQTKNPVTPT